MHSPEPQNVLFIQLPNISLMEYTFLMGHAAKIWHILSLWDIQLTFVLRGLRVLCITGTES